MLVEYIHYIMELSALKNLRRNFNRFCFRHRNWGIPNLMLYISLGSALVYIMTVSTNNAILYYWLMFDRNLILQGQVWRLITYPLTSVTGNPIMALLFLVCYYSLGRGIEHVWGTLRFNLFYFSGVIMMDIYCMIFPCQADAYYLNLSLFLTYATMYPDAHFLLFFIIPVKARFFALIDLALVVFGLIAYPFPVNLFSIISLANYFLFMGSDVVNLIPPSWRANFKRLFRKKKKYAPEQPRVVPFPKAGSYQAEVARPTAPYTHRCTVCGRTDVSDPELEFRYCSRCSGYHCYCQEHISNHSHI